NGLPGAWMPRCNVIPADAGIQIRGTAWIPACAGMTTTLRTPFVDTLVYITDLDEALQTRRQTEAKSDKLSVTVDRKKTTHCIPTHGAHSPGDHTMPGYARAPRTGLQS